MTGPGSGPLRAVGRRVGGTFSSLAIRNYRLYFIGQVVSVSGSWMQRVAQAWLVLHLSGSGVALGLVSALQFLPVLLLVAHFITAVVGLYEFTGAHGLKASPGRVVLMALTWVP